MPVLCTVERNTTELCKPPACPDLTLSRDTWQTAQRTVLAQMFSITDEIQEVPSDKKTAVLGTLSV